MPFLANPLNEFDASSGWDKPISDLSLLGIFDHREDWLKCIVETLPDPLKDLCEEERKNNPVGLHVTLYEFMHTKGGGDHALLDRLLSNRLPFLAELIHNFKTLGNLHMIVRQGIYRPRSLQVFVDVFLEIESNFINAMDEIINRCLKTTNAMKPKIKEKLNINSAPCPLHITLLRFSKEPTDELKKEARIWEGKYKRRIWGISKELQIVLTGARRFPFYDVKKEIIK